MVNDHRIMNVFDSYPLTVPILNYLFNLTRRIKQQELDEMQILIVESTGSKMEYRSKSGKEHPYAVSVVNKDFYSEAATEIGCSINYFRKYFYLVEVLLTR